MQITYLFEYFYFHTDLGLFSTRGLVDANPSQKIEISTQPFAVSEDALSIRTWNCVWPRSHSTIAKYGNYQAASFQDSLKVSVTSITIIKHVVKSNV